MNGNATDALSSTTNPATGTTKIPDRNGNNSGALSAIQRAAQINSGFKVRGEI
ncbi:hypothetical protein F7C95_16935 [Opitutia bacterium ISCC 51]|nr:hypothetical protein F7C95_16935 [Opitutae bacterium ISCC 51]QXD27660.1 hypothetical protein GA003_16835 [Opitutae bacterium ISCC 52]